MAYQSSLWDSCVLPSGVPEGSILGALLFILFSRACIGNYDLVRVSEFTNPGVVVEENLSWKAGAKYLIAKGGKRVGMWAACGKTYSCNKCDTDRLGRLQR